MKRPLKDTDSSADEEETKGEFEEDSSDSEAERQQEKQASKAERQVIFEFPRDIYSLMLIMFMRERGHKHVRWGRFLWPACLCAVCMVAQYMCVMAGQRHVVDAMDNHLWDPVSLAIWELSHMNRTLPDEKVDEICGIYQDYPAPGAADFPTIRFPVDTSGELKGYFFYGKMPKWTWSTKNLGEDKSVIDTARLILEEGFFGYKTGYGLLVVLIFFMWSASVLVEIRKQLHFLMMLALIPGTGPKVGSVHKVVRTIEADQGPQVEEDPDAAQFEVTHMSLCAKILGCFLVLFQLFIAVLVGSTGFVFLRATASKMDLILNTLALLFVLELDDIVFHATTSKGQLKFFDQLQPIRYESAVPMKYMNYHGFAFPMVAMVLCTLSAFASRWSQINDFSQLFNAAAGACLFAGSRTPGKDFSVLPEGYSPVPGMCESLLSINCLKPPDKQEGATYPTWVGTHGPCVVTDFADVWARNVRRAADESIWVGHLQELVEGGALPGYNAFANTGQIMEKDPRLKKKYELKVDNDVTRSLFSACLAMYHNSPTMMRVVDRDTGADNPVADFHCSKDDSIGMSSYFQNIEFEDTASWLWIKFFGKGCSRVTFGMDLLGREEKLGIALGKCKLGA